jgi:hypothetical protein
MNYRNVSNPAAFGVQWSAGENGNDFQLVNPRGTTGLLFGMRNTREGRSNWSTTSVVDPSRFGLNAPPTNYKEFLAVARSYIEE